MLDYSNLIVVISLQPLLNILSKLNQTYSVELLYCMPTKYNKNFLVSAHQEIFH